MDRKDIIIEALEKMRKKEVADKEPYKARAYAIVNKQIKALTGPVTSFDDLKGVNGIGEKIKEKIEEIFETGKLKAAEVVNANPHYQVIDTLLKVHGIGPAKAKQLVEEHGVRSISELRERQDKLLNDKQKMGLKYYEEFDLRIPRAEMLKHEEYIKEIFKSFEKGYVVEVSGSFRRGEKDSGDIDLLITHPDETLNHDQMFSNIITKFINDKYITDIFARGNKKCLAVCKAKRHKHSRRIDLMMTAKHEFPFALLYFTGSGPFNVEMRNWAIERGLSLSEYGLKHLSGEKKGQFVDHVFHNERDIFKYLGLEYIPPCERKANVLTSYRIMS